MNDSILPAGTLLNHGKYVLKKRIGKGDFGITYEGLEVKTNHKMAITEFFLPRFFERDEKGAVLPGKFAQERFEHFKEEFIKEGRRIARYKLEGIIYIAEVFEDLNTAFMVTRFVEGPTLQELVNKTGPIPEDQALRHITNFALALEELHRANILHLNITPENIIVHKTGKAVLTGFGVARYHIYNETPYRMAKLTPFDALEEYKKGEKLTPLTDIYSLGAVLFYALTATVPTGPVARIEKPLLPPRHFNKKISEKTSLAVMKAMAMAPENRYQSIKAFLSELLPNGYPEKKVKGNEGFFKNLFDFKIKS